MNRILESKTIRFLIVCLVWVLLLFIPTITAYASASDFVLIGDSRVVGIGSAIGAEKIKGDGNKKTTCYKENENYIIGKVGEGLKWLKSDGIKEAEPYQNKRIIIWMGTNDLYNVSKYAEYINGLDAEVVVVSCGPVADAKAEANGYKITNKKVEEFNKTLKKELKEGISWIDISDVVKPDDIGRDGLHYTKDGYKKVYEKILAFLKEKDGPAKAIRLF